jgi:hypothetical protein
MLLELMKRRRTAMQDGDFSTASFLSLSISGLSDTAGALDPYASLDDLIFIKQAYHDYNEYKRKIPVHDLALAGIHLEVVLDAIIPNSWSFDDDLVILDSSLVDEIMFEYFLQNVGQKRYLFIGSAENSETRIDGSIPNADQILEKLGPILPGRLAFLTASDNREAIIFENQVRDGLARLKMMRNTIQHFDGVWMENLLKGIPFYSKAVCASQLKDYFDGSEVLVVSPGPSLLRCGEDLAKRRSDFIILAVAQAIPALTSLNIVPDFVMVVDPLDY